MAGPEGTGVHRHGPFYARQACLTWRFLEEGGASAVQGGPVCCPFVPLSWHDRAELAGFTTRARERRCS
jgi:hypothetical protein